MTYKKKLTAFLKANYAFKKFKRNYEPCGITISEYIEDTPAPFLIEEAFSWLSSPEGFEYWDKLNDKWLSQLNN